MGVFAYLQKSEEDKTIEPGSSISSIFELGLNEKGKIIYEFYFDNYHKMYEEFYLMLKGIDVSSKSVEIYAPGFVDAYYKTPSDLTLGKKITCFVTEEGGAHIRLIGISKTKAIFETWFQIGEPHPLGPLKPKEIIIEK